MTEHLVTVNNRFLQADYWASCSCGWETEGTSKALAEETAQAHTAAVGLDTPERKHADRQRAFDDLQFAVYAMLEQGCNWDEIHEAVQDALDDAAES